MLTKRIIPCLDIKNGRTVKGVNFEGLRDAGDPVELARRYSEEGADELVFWTLPLHLKNEERWSNSLPELQKKSIFLSQWVVVSKRWMKSKSY